MITNIHNTWLKDGAFNTFLRKIGGKVIGDSATSAMLGVAPFSTTPIEIHVQTLGNDVFMNLVDDALQDHLIAKWIPPNNLIAHENIDISPHLRDTYNRITNYWFETPNTATPEHSLVRIYHSNANINDIWKNSTIEGVKLLPDITAAAVAWDGSAWSGYDLELTNKKVAYFLNPDQSTIESRISQYESRGVTVIKKKLAPA